MVQAIKLDQTDPLPHLTVFFIGHGHGWRENYYSTQKLADPTFADQAQRMLQARARMLAPGYIIQAAMASDDRTFRDSALAKPVPIKNPGTGADSAYYNEAFKAMAAADPDISLGYRFEGGVTYRATRKLPGVPIGASQNPFDPNYNAADGFLVAEQMWISIMTTELTTGAGSPWGLKVRDQHPTGLDNIPITGITTDPDGHPILQLKSSIGKQWDYVIVSMAKCKPGSAYINGVHIAKYPLDNTQVTLADVKGPVTWDHGGSVRGFHWLIVPITRVIPRGPLGRKRGARGYSPPVGRSKRPPLLVP